MNGLPKPTQQEIDSARAYLARRLDTALIIEERYEYLFNDAVMKIASIVSKYKQSGKKVRAIGSSRCAREIQLVIQDLIDAVRELVEEYCCPPEADEDNRKKTITRVISENDHDATFEERMEADKTMILSKINNGEVNNFDGTDSELVSLIYSLSKMGRNRLLMLAINSIALGWITSMAIDAFADGKDGFWIINGPNPCKYCASMEGEHPMTDPMPPYHVRCQCTIVFV